MLNKLILRAFLSISLALSFTGAANATLISQDILFEKLIDVDANGQAARLNIKMLNSLDDIHISVEEADGSVGSRPMTATEKASKLTLSKKHEQLYCEK